MNITDKERKDFDEYRATHPGATWNDYGLHCYDEYRKHIEQKLNEHYARNDGFLRQRASDFEDFVWLQKFMKNYPVSCSRDEMGAVVFEAFLKVMGCFNSIMMEMARDELNYEVIKQLFDNVNQQRKILQDYGKA